MDPFKGRDPHKAVSDHGTCAACFHLSHPACAGWRGRILASAGLNSVELAMISQCSALSQPKLARARGLRLVGSKGP